MVRKRYRTKHMKKTLAFLAIAILGTAIWYFFLKSHDYQVTFEVKTFPGEVNQFIKAWGKTQEGSIILDEKPISELTQQFQFGDSTHIYQWKITAIHESLSQVQVYAKDKDHSFQNRLSIPFYDTDFEKRTRTTLLDFDDKLNEHRKKFKVEVLGEYETPGTFCACTDVKSTQMGKADDMMRGFPVLASFLTKNDIPLNGTPFLEVIDWKKGKDSLEYKFCFPIVYTDSLPEHPELSYRNYYGKKALKAVYTGNYITSDRAWYVLIDYAKNNNIEIAELPVEVFFDNPNMGANPLTWKAEIFMPLKASSND